MDVKTSRHLRPPVSTFHFSFLVGDHLTDFRYPTVAKRSSTPFSEVWHSGPRTPIRMTPSRLDIPLFTDASALLLPPLRLRRLQSHLTRFSFSFIDERSLKSRRFLFLVSQNSPQDREICETYPA